MFDTELATPYSSQAQRIRVMSEHWTHGNLYCPNCGTEPLSKLPNNRLVADFQCPGCSEIFELKSKRGPFGRKVTDGAYSAMMKRLLDEDSPSLFLLSYGGQPPAVMTFTVVPKQFLIPSLIEQRRPLSPNARRAGWIGCNILLDGIPDTGRIALYDAGGFRTRGYVQQTWKNTMFLRKQANVAAKTWLIRLMQAIEGLGQPTFSLADLYRLEEWFSSFYPDNRNIRPKIRQQLQNLRDVGYLNFLGNGTYRLRDGRAKV